MKNLFFLFIVLVAAGVALASCAKSQDSSSTGSTSMSSSNAATMASSGTMMAAQANSLPIPLAKLPAAKVAPGNATAGAAVFTANCASCHGAGGKNGQVGPTLAGAGLKAGQVAYMIRSPQGVDKSSGMPKLPLTDKQVADVAAYVASLK